MKAEMRPVPCPTEASNERHQRTRHQKRLASTALVGKPSAKGRIALSITLQKALSRAAAVFPPSL